MTDPTLTPLHFAPWGSVITSCGAAVYRGMTNVTDRRDDTTCPRCCAHFTNRADSRTPQPLDLDAIRARADAATPGPWAIVERNGDHIRRKLRGADDQFILGLAALLYPDPADEEFLTHAREDVPALIAEVKALRSRITAAQDALKGPRAGENIMRAWDRAIVRARKALAGEDA